MAALNQLPVELLLWHFLPIARDPLLLLLFIFRRLHGSLNNNAGNVHGCATLATCVIVKLYAFDFTSLALVADLG
jgi:hypothetical protein